MIFTEYPENANPEKFLKTKKGIHCMKTFTYPAIFTSDSGEIVVSIPDFDLMDIHCGNNIADGMTKAEEILGDTIQGCLSKGDKLPEPYGNASAFTEHMIVRLKVHIPDLKDACKVVTSELAKKEFFWDAMVSTVKAAISDKVDDLDEDVDTLLIDDIAEFIVERIGGWS